MGTLLEELDGNGCLSRALQGEPLFILLGRDPMAPGLVDRWAHFRMADVSRGKRPSEDAAQVIEAHQLAQDMREWRERVTAQGTFPWREPQGDAPPLRLFLELGSAAHKGMEEVGRLERELADPGHPLHGIAKVAEATVVFVHNGQRWRIGVGLEDEPPAGLEYDLTEGREGLAYLDGKVELLAKPLDLTAPPAPMSDEEQAALEDRYRKD